MSVSVCKSCMRPVRWVKTPTGSMMPIDAASVPAGNVLLTGDHARVLSRGELAGMARMPGVVLHTSHFATCPNAAHHRANGRGAGAVRDSRPDLFTEPSPPPPTRPAAPPAPVARRRMVDVWCDGSCPVPMGPGGWAAVMRYLDLDEHVVLGEREIAGYELDTTNQAMELMAAAEALYEIRRPSLVKVTSDSKYLVDGMSKRWWVKWQRNGWHNAQGKPVVNRPLWEALIAADQFHTVTWAWVKGHNKGASPLNERADELAGEQTTIAQEVVVDQAIRPLLDELDNGLDRALQETADA